MTKDAADQKTLQLIELVKTKKAEIAKLNKPNWKTNCAFSFLEGDKGRVVNLHVESDVHRLAKYAAFILRQQKDFDEATKFLGVSSTFKWDGYSAEDWLDDIKLRVDKVQIQSKKDALEKLESRLNAIISPELRAQMELDAIAAELS